MPCDSCLHLCCRIPTPARLTTDVSGPSSAASSTGVEGGASHFWLCGCGAASPPIKEVGPAPVFEAAFDGEHGVGSRFRPVAPRSFEPAPDDALAGAFHEAGSDRQAALPVEVAAHSVPVGLAVADAGRDGFKPTVRLRSAMTRSTRPASSCFLILSIHAARSPSSGAASCTAAAAYSRA